MEPSAGEDGAWIRRARGRTAQALCAPGRGEDASCTQMVASAPGTRLCNCRVETPDDLLQGPAFALYQARKFWVASPSRRFHSSVRGHPDPDRGCSQQLCFCKKPELPPLTPAPTQMNPSDTMNNKDREQNAHSRGPK